MTWDPNQYARFARERSRPFFDLLARVEAPQVTAAVDLGCGAGELTRVLAERWPPARITGVDSSREMLAKAQPLALPGRLRFEQADLAAWRATEPLDLVLSNAALHWVPGHETLLAALAGLLAPGGTLAVQMPNNFDLPSHRLLARLTASPRWQAAVGGLGLPRGAVRPLPWYVHRLREAGFRVDAWETTYVHVLRGDDAVLEWMKGTALRPILGRLSPADEDELLQELGDGLRAAYPAEGGDTLFPFPRIFFVAVREA
jgi:trans-aconitate 2-methyltransferase